MSSLVFAVQPVSLPAGAVGGLGLAAVAGIGFAGVTIFRRRFQRIN